MQHLENDMEDLFKRAGENYSPQKGKSDWENIAKQLADKSLSSSVMEPAKNNRNRKIIALFTLLFILSVSLFMIRNTASKLSSAADQNGLLKTATNISDKEKIKINTSSINRADKAFDIYPATNSGNTYRIKPIASLSHTSIEEKTTIDYPFSDFTNNSEDSYEGKRKSHLLINKADNEQIDVLSLQNLTGNSYDAPSKLRYNADNLQQNTPHETLFKMDDNPSSIKKRKKESAEMLTKNKGFYFGLTLASDFSKVQSPSFHNTGFDAGLLAGLRVNKRVSFETGLIWNKKSYNSEGKNFSTDKVRSTMPAGMIINDLESRTSLIEIPVKVRYDFLQKRKSGFFVAGGISSYIMTTEKNKYNVTMNGNQEIVSGVYKKNNYGIPAVANFSIGFEQSISKKVNIRIEPFLKIPLQGMGVGSLPVTSAGLQVGITSRLK